MQQNIICQKSLSEFNKLICFTNAFAAKHSIQANYLKILTLIIEEYFTNFVKYQKPLSSKFILKLMAEQSKICIEININGSCFNPIFYHNLNKKNCLGLNIILNLTQSNSHSYVNNTNILTSSIPIN